MIFLCALDDPARDFFDLLFCKYRQAMYHVAARIVRDEDTAADVVQQTFLKLLRSEKVRGLSGHNLDAFVMIATRNNAIDVVRKQRRIPAEVVTFEENQHSRQNGSTVEESAELLTLIDELSTLSTVTRDAVALHCHFGYTYRETGELLGISAEAARKRVCRGVDQLREFWMEE